MRTARAHSQGRVWDHSQSTKGTRALFRPFWRRIGIVQELCVAKRVIFACGHATVSWDTFKKAVLQFTVQERSTLYNLVLRNSVVTNSLSPSIALRVFNLVQRYKTEITPLGDLVRLILRAECTDPGDKNVSLLGLAQDAPSKALVPNYTRLLY